jgi:hypothetical protein
MTHSRLGRWLGLGNSFRKSPRCRPNAARLTVENLEDRLTPSVTVNFDYQALGAAANGFDAAAQQALNAAGHALGDHLSNPAAVAVSGGTVTYADIDPSTGMTRSGSLTLNQPVAANEVYVAVENSDLSALRKSGTGPASTGSQGTFSALSAGAISRRGCPGRPRRCWGKGCRLLASPCWAGRGWRGRNGSRPTSTPPQSAQSLTRLATKSRGCGSPPNTISVLPLKVSPLTLPEDLTTYLLGPRP